MPASGPQSGPSGLLIAAPSSGAGKTTVTLALLRALKRQGLRVASAKSGPDYIDPAFHEAASGEVCINLDAWAMDPQTLQALAVSRSSAKDLLLVEGAMGLFDGAANGTGSAADLAASLGVPVVLVVDCAKQAQSVAALVHGFLSFRPDVPVAAVILNRVGSARHEKMLRAALAGLPVKVIGALPRSEALVLPERHLGLVQAGEHPQLDDFLEQAADTVSNALDLGLLRQLAAPLSITAPEPPNLPDPIGQKIAVASDIAFAFSYPHLLSHWQNRGATLETFSPLADEKPASTSDAVYLPGGYPELHAGRLAAASEFRAGMRSAADAGCLVYGECGGYMTLGDGLVDAEGVRHQMLGLLPLETSFQHRKRHLGYRVVEPLGGLPWVGNLSAHEFHYASVLFEGDGDRLFTAADADGQKLDPMGLRRGRVMGSFAHVISNR
ncbi:cobyrinate a,c-diamide synthase [Roseibium denhamense]|uniref:Hydrogenobyrinate a,c-diamide synthase n=1 Tax=Roseibium denhamense TaxID=76305 RepID=A0ABY1PKE6_9HYPH|nr:cobyrinate a,c-diamide synthase [Roseibium denhamense]MTI05571.1 cobyrinate a,c-diamide synthase [Roseibium denhamense]SMP34757.1 cobyrinic acid a,c-diamide synthase [Roseibium denhamense]